MYVAPINDLDEKEREEYGITREFKNKMNELIEAINALDTRLQALEG
tara:strand:+ start:532 stop:672 length:141 start_codon:yes stop_codon:yes gene_type:complete